MPSEPNSTRDYRDVVRAEKGYIQCIDYRRKRDPSPLRPIQAAVIHKTSWYDRVL